MPRRGGYTCCLIAPPKFIAVRKGTGSRWWPSARKNRAYAQFMKRLRPFAWFIIIVNVFLIYVLFSQLGKDSNQYFQAGAVAGYLFMAGSLNLILYVLFRITAKRK
jgi:hypothetical protein